MLRKQLFAWTFALILAHTAVTDASAASGSKDGAPRPPSAEYPFISQFVRVDGHRIHYVEQGPRHAKPILLVHGNFTWSYLWRNVLPALAKQTHRRVIAVDLLGMGRSDKPALTYTPQLHAQVLGKFIQQLRLHDVLLVGHDWGGAIMTGYAIDHPWNVQGLVLLETLAWTLELEDFGPFAPFLQLPRSPEGQHLLINDPTWFAHNIIRPAVLNPDLLTDEILARYLEPFPTAQSRTAMAAFPLLTPFVDDPLTVPVSLDYFNDIEARRAVLADKPLLLIRANPGMAISELSFDKFQAFAAVLSDVEIRHFGPGLHFIQEDNPARLAWLISDWVRDKRLQGRDVSR